jgi:hypothetical protein
MVPLAIIRRGKARRRLTDDERIRYERGPVAAQDAARYE